MLQVKKTMNLTIIILAHNEEKTIKKHVEDIKRKIINKIKRTELIIFHDGSRDSTHKILLNQILKGLQGVNKLNNIFIAYEPVWSIGTGIVPKSKDLEKDIKYIKTNVKKKFRFKKPKVLYGGSVNPSNIKNLKEINIIDGFLVGGASQDPKKFIDIVKKTFI